MAQAWPDWAGRWRGCSYKRATFVLCTGNVVMALFMLHAVLAPICFDSSPSPHRDLADSSDGAPFRFLEREAHACLLVLLPAVLSWDASEREAV
jgi:hypothetical protein